MPSITLTRQQLYDRAWTTPLDALAKELGLSGRGLGKVCERHDIPVPPRGWWSKKAAGHPVELAPLPAAPPGTATRMTFAVPNVEGAPESASEPDTHPLVLHERLDENKIEVPEDLPFTDPLIVKTRRLLNKGKRDSGGLIPAPAGGLHIHTSRSLHERALRIMQALLLAFAKRGFPVSTTADGVRVSILDENFRFGIEKSLKKVDHAVTFTEQKQIDRGMGWQVPKFDQVPSGDLTVVITNVHGLRQRWSEGAYRPSQRLLNKFIVGLVRAALAVKRPRAEAERRELERQELELYFGKVPHERSSNR